MDIFYTLVRLQSKERLALYGVQSVLSHCWFHCQFFGMWNTSTTFHCIMVYTNHHHTYIGSTTMLPNFEEDTFLLFCGLIPNPGTFCIYKIFDTCSSCAQQTKICPLTILLVGILLNHATALLNLQLTIYWQGCIRLWVCSYWTPQHLIKYFHFPKCN